MIVQGYDSETAWQRVKGVVDYISKFNDKLREKKKKLLEKHKNKNKSERQLIKIESEIDKDNQKKWNKEFEKLWQDT